MHMAMHIDTIQKLNVYPRTQNQDQKKLITLSNLDRQCPLLMYMVFFYKKTTTRDFDSVFSDLKLGLEETLSVWYPAAGRLVLDGGGCKLNLQCNGGGAVMLEAVARGVKLCELGDLTQYNEFYETLVYKPSFDGDFSVMPLVVAQVTKFACGGYSIGIGTSHSLFDGISAYEFLHAWAFNSNIHNKSKGKYTNPKDHNLVIKPVHDRGNLLFNRDVNRNMDVVRVTKAAAIYHLYQLIKQTMMAQQGQNCNFEVPESGFVIKTFELSGEAIESMKKKSLDGFSCSSFEFLAAHLWKARTSVLGLRKDSMVCLQFAVDIRKRTEPPLPKGFSGNAYVLASVSSTAGELIEELTLQSIINKIREAKKSINQDYINSYMEALEGRNDGNLPHLKELTLISDWTKMSFHNLAFGNDGEAADYVAPLCPPVPQVGYFMKNPKDVKGIIVRIGLDPLNVHDFSNNFLGY